MVIGVGANLQFGTPDPLNEFDDLILPQGLFQLSMMLTMTTIVLQIYRILCLLIIYRAARWEKSYWRKLKEEFYDENYSTEQRKKYGGLKPPKLISKKAEMSLGLMNWLERLMDPLVSTLKSKSTLRSVSLSGQDSAGSSLKTDMMDSSGNSFSGQLAQQSIVGSKTESDGQVINYLLRMGKEHECELCSITEDIDYGRFSNSMFNQGFHLFGTALGLFAQMRTYNQIIFYLCGSFHILMSYGLTFHDSLGKLHLYKILTRSDVCGYMKMKMVNESAVLISNLLLLFSFATLFGFYVAYDDYISMLLNDHLLFIF